jgi:hypothetical protein
VVLGSFKSASSRQAGARIWQSSYWERIIRNEELNRIRAYIDENPRRWPTDPENVGVLDPRRIISFDKHWNDARMGACGQLATVHATAAC